LNEKGYKMFIVTQTINSQEKQTMQAWFALTNIVFGNDTEGGNTK